MMTSDDQANSNIRESERIRKERYREDPYLIYVNLTTHMYKITQELEALKGELHHTRMKVASLKK